MKYPPEEPPFRASFIHARRGDPSTSHEAVPARLAYHAFVVLGAYRHGHHLIDHEAYERVNFKAARQRCSDLRRWKLIERTGERGITPSQKSAYKCRITAAGLNYLRNGWAERS
jgi:hypothetical protein